MFVTYICAEYVRVLAVVGDNDPGLGGFGEHLLAQLACTATLDAVEVGVHSDTCQHGAAIGGERERTRRHRRSSRREKGTGRHRPVVGVL